MSKRGSKNAKIFGGKIWRFGKIAKNKFSNKKIKSSADLDFLELCQKFGLNPKNKPFIYAEFEDKFKSGFISFNEITRKEIIKEVTVYKKQCKRNKVEPDINKYLSHKISDAKFFMELNASFNQQR